MASGSSLCVFILLFQVLQIKAQITNVALNKATTQSFTYRGAVSSRAVDGNTDAEFNRGSCTHTQLVSPGWWCVDLLYITSITNITIYNRNNNKERLQSFEIRLRSDDQCNEQGLGSATSCYINTPPTVQDVYTVDSCNQQPSTSLSARTVFINTTDTITLCEVEIYAGCKDGDNCQSCNVTTSVCSRCVDGYWNNSCQQQCSNNCNNGGCRQVDGYCNNGCKVGWYGDTCDTSCNQQCFGNCNRNTGQCSSCKQGYYGTNCQLLCDYGCTNSYCNKDTGVCTQGCRSGFTGSKCETCAQGRYGTACQSTCLVTNCIGNCDRDTGQCDTCKPDWYGTNCETTCSVNCTGDCNKSTGRCTECKPGIFGDNCEKPCPVNCADTCTRDDGRCNSCKPNTVGLYCNSACGTGCLPITDGTQETCDRNGRCTECIVGRYGDRCDMSCSTSCNGNCNRSTGRCISCIKGKSGDTCDQSCNENCTDCNQDDINDCSQCKDNKYYGASCNYQCSLNCKHGSCYQGNGHCSFGCVDGKMGMDCSEIKSDKNLTTPYRSDFTTSVSILAVK